MSELECILKNKIKFALDLKIMKAEIHPSQSLRVCIAYSFP